MLFLKYEKSYFSYYSHKKELNMQVDNGKYLFGICKVGERGQIVIPKEAREIFNIKAGDSLMLFGDNKKGLALIKGEIFSAVTEDILGDKK